MLRSNRSGPALLRLEKPGRIDLARLLRHPATDITVMALIIVSVFLLVLEVTLEPGHDSSIVVAGDAITAVFAVELTLRFIVAKKKLRFVWRYWPDILAILPLLRPLRFFRFLRLFRLFRLFQLGLLLDRRVAMLRGVLRVNFYFLWVLLMFTVMLVVGGAVVAFLLEQSTGEDFSSLRGALWWATYSTLAGEPINSMPNSTAGRALLVALMLGGTGLSAVFTGLVSATMITRLQGMERVNDMEIDELEGHLVVCGWNQGAKPLLAELAVDPLFAGQPFVLLNERDGIPDLADVGVRAELVLHLKGDFTQLAVLRRAGIERAARAVVLADDSERHQRGDRDARSVLAALTIERMQPDIYCVVELMDGANTDHLKVAGVEAVIMRNDLSGRALASACRHPRLASVMMDLFTARDGARLERLPGPVHPMDYGALLERCKRELGHTIIGVERSTGELLVNPEPSHVVLPEDHLVVVFGQARLPAPPRPVRLGSGS